jgi:hypothetical protein
MEKRKKATIRIPRKNAGYTELSKFFDRHDGVDLQDQGIMETDPDRNDLDRMLLEHLNRSNPTQSSIRRSHAARRLKIN